MLGRIEALINPERAAKHKHVLDAWRNIRENHKELTQKTLLLLRHPDATEAQVLQVRDVYRNSYERVKMAQQHMRERYGNRVWIDDIGG